MQHYTLNYGNDHNRVENIARAYRAAGMQPPNRADDLRGILDDEPTADAVALTLAAESLTVDDLTTWTEDALSRIQRAQAADAFKSAIAGHRAHAAKQNRGSLIRAATTDLAKPFAATVKKLTTAAAKLPAGDDPLNLEAVVATDTTAERRTVVESLTLLAALASVHTPNRSDLGVRQRDCLFVVDLPEVAWAHVNRLTREVINPDPVRDQVRSFLRDADRHGPDRALIGVARGEYGDRIVLSLAADPAEVSARIDRALQADGGRLVDDTRTERPAKAKAFIQV